MPTDDEYDDDRPRRRPRNSRDDEDEDRPARRQRDEDDDDYDDKPRRGGGKPHRGVMILIFGILSFVCCPLIFGLLAFFMGSADLKEMDAGRMDPSGRGLTKAGMILGIVGLVLGILVGIANVALNVGRH